MLRAFVAVGRADGPESVGLATDVNEPTAGQDAFSTGLSALRPDVTRGGHQFEREGDSMDADAASQAGPDPQGGPDPRGPEQTTAAA